jgi:hypothetical protein
MGIMKKFNEYFYSGANDPQGAEPHDTTSGGDEMEKLKELESGAVNKVEVNGYQISRPSELEGDKNPYLIVKDKTHARKSNIEEVMAVVEGKLIFESYRSSRKRK